MNNYFDHNDSIVSQSKSKANVYMNQVYGWMCVGLALTGLVAWYASQSDAILNALFRFNEYGQATGLSGLSWLLLIAQIGLVFVISGMINRISGSTATLLFMLYSLLTGLSLMPIFLAYTATSIATVFFICSAMFAALALYGYTTKRDLSALGRFLFMGLIGIIIASVVNIFLKSEGMSMVISYIGVLVFAGLTAYDTQKLKELSAKMSQDDTNVFRRYVILGALTMYLDFINLFIMLLRILGDRR